MAASAMTLTEMRQFVWNALDTDVTDLTTDLLDRYIVDGSNRVDEYSDSWAFRAVDYSFTTVANQAAYAAYGIDVLDTVTHVTARLRRIEDVRGPLTSFSPADHTEMRRLFPTTAAPAGTPYAFSTWGDSLYLWPSPSTAFDVSVTGYRSVSNWTEETPDSPDFPAEFHELIAWWALNRGHAREGDPQMADFYRQEFEVALKARARKHLGGLVAQALILGGGKSQREKYRTESALGPLIYPFE